MATLGDDRQRTGIGMTSPRTRARMVERLREQGIADEVFLTAMNAVPRHIFVDEALAVDAIVVTAGATHVPTALLRYLNPGGRMVLPLTQGGDERGVQRLTVLDATPAGLREQTLDAVRFVPLLPGLA